MKFGRTLREKILKEWRFYAVDYKALKKTLKKQDDNDLTSFDSNNNNNNDNNNNINANSINVEEFHRILDESQQKLEKFYSDKEAWANGYLKTLEERVENLRQSASNPPSPCPETSELSSLSSSGSSSAEHGFMEKDIVSYGSPNGPIELSMRSFHQRKKQLADNSWLKEEYRRVGKSKHFHNFIYAKKSLATFERELNLLMEFLDLNNTAFSKILKKFDKRTGSSIREKTIAELQRRHPFLKGQELKSLRHQVSELIDEVNTLRPRLPEGWEDRKVYTIGCFDLFHRGHQNVLLSLREFGYFIVAGIHDDASYFKLKNKYPIDNLETRMKNVKPFVDQLFVIPSTDPLLYIKSVVSEQDIETGSCCYARGDDMLNFPGRDWVESMMPVYFVPRTESCSSTLIRTIYHAEDESLRSKAAFAKTRYDGKPVDEEGNVLKLKG